MAKGFYHTKRERIAYLKVTTWVGTSVYRACHYYGRLQFRPEHNKREDSIERQITAEEAIRFNKEDPDGTGGYKTGDASSRFWDEPTLRAMVISLWRQECEGAELLLEGDHITLDPQLALDGPPELVAKLNEIYKECEAIDFWEGNKESRAKMQELSNQWNRLIEENLTTTPNPL